MRDKQFGYKWRSQLNQEVFNFPQFWSLTIIIIMKVNSWFTLLAIELNCFVETRSLVQKVNLKFLSWAVLWVKCRKIQNLSINSSCILTTVSCNKCENDHECIILIRSRLEFLEHFEMVPWMVCFLPET